MSTGIDSTQSAIPAISTINLGDFLDGSPETRHSIAVEVDRICRETGFLIIENHGVEKSVIDAAWSISRQFFELPLTEKLKSRSADPYCPRGYFPMASETLAKSLGVVTPPDIKESFSIGPLDKPPLDLAAEEMDFHYGDNLWPAQPPDMRSKLMAYFHSMEVLSALVLQLFAAALDLSRHYFEQFHQFPMCALRCINYPESDDAPLPGQRGAGEHSDYGSFTILKPDPLVQGLEIRLPCGQWAAAPPVENAFIINIGDMMARWTNDRWVSTLHRVTSPMSENGTVRRQSMAFFHNASFDAEIRCIPTCIDANQPAKYSSVSAGAYLADRFRSAVTDNE